VESVKPNTDGYLEVRRSDTVPDRSGRVSVYALMLLEQRYVLNQDRARLFGRHQLVCMLCLRDVQNVIFQSINVAEWGSMLVKGRRS
jgi:hypothetical protein